MLTVRPGENPGNSGEDSEAKMDAFTSMANRNA